MDKPNRYHRACIKALPPLYRLAAEEMVREGLIEVIEEMEG
jgi:hypothetical protein